MSKQNKILLAVTFFFTLTIGAYCGSYAYLRKNKFLVRSETDYLIRDVLFVETGKNCMVRGIGVSPTKLFMAAKKTKGEFTELQRTDRQYKTWFWPLMLLELKTRGFMETEKWQQRLGYKQYRWNNKYHVAVVFKTK